MAFAAAKMVGVPLKIMIYKKYLLLFLFLLFSIFNISAQKTAETVQPCDQDFARMLVEQQVNEGKSVEETDKRIKILLRAADFLWKFDEPTARSYFSDAFDLAGKRFSEKGLENKETVKEKFTFISETKDYRTEVVQAIAKKDGAWAKILSEKLLKDYEADLENRKDSYEKIRELSQILQIAIDSAKTNPETSLYFFRRVMQYPLDQHWFRALYDTARNNRNLSDQVYLELLRNYAGESPRKMLILSAYPFASDRVFGVQQYGMNVPEDFSANENLQIQFLNQFFNSIDKFSNNADEFGKIPEAGKLPETAYIVSALRDFELIIPRKNPNLLPRFNIVKAKADGLLSEEARNNLDDRKKASERNNRSFNAKLKELEDADAEGKLTDFMIVDLIFRLEKEEQYEKAESWIGKIKNEKVREDAKNYFYFRRSQIAAVEKRLTDAEKFAEAVSEIQLRAVLLFKIAEQQLKSDYQQNEAESVLLKVSKIARKAEPSIEKAQVLLGLSNMFEKINHAYALDELGEAVRTINQLENPDIFATSTQQIIVGDKFGFYAAFDTPGFNMENTFEAISKKDFQLSLAQAKSFSDRYFRTLAVLAVAKNCVENAPKGKVRSEK